MNILVIHGPNLNLLGEREVSVYGELTLNEINQKIEEYASEHEAKVRFFQSNHEGAIIDCIQANRNIVDGIVINPAAYTHYSIAIRDALATVTCPIVEVHLSDINKREPFRRISMMKDVCAAQISGKGVYSYLEGLDFLFSINNAQANFK